MPWIARIAVHQDHLGRIRPLKGFLRDLFSRRKNQRGWQRWGSEAIPETEMEDRASRSVAVESDDYLVPQIESGARMAQSPRRASLSNARTTSSGHPMTGL